MNADINSLILYTQPGIGVGWEKEQARLVRSGWLSYGKLRASGSAGSFGALWSLSGMALDLGLPSSGAPKYILTRWD